ncbi:MAG TPA: O-antigen ligase family protein [Acidimicrobiia bacterium]|nr:O-antigen ligase family protein [Acidimicrobiia bacterium]
MSTTAAALQPPVTRVRAKTARLPYGWPLYAAFGLFPLWYVTGFGALMWFFLAIPMTFHLVARSSVRIPKGFGLFMLFFIWMAATIIQLQGSGMDRIFGFLYRAGLYYSAAVWCLYIYNAPKRLLPTRTILKAITFMWIVVVAGGWLGIASPTMEFTTLAEKVIPRNLQNNDLVYTLIHPKVAEVQTFLGYEVPRPQAPFDFANNWGANFALMLPFVCAFWGQLRTLTRRNVLRLVAVGSLVPVVFSLNRTLWLALIVILVYGGARFAVRGRRGSFQAICAVAIVAYVLFNFGPTGKLIADRAKVAHSNSGRALLYNEAADSVQKSPMMGYGAPRASQRNPNLPPVGTQGQFWLVFFSHGFPGAIFFVGFVGYAVMRTRRAKTSAALWCHITLLVGLIIMPFYGWLHMQVHIFLIAFALASREMVDPDEAAEPLAPGQPRTYVVSESLTEGRVPALTGGNGNGYSNGNGNGHGPVTGSDLTPWGRAGDAPEGWS